MRFYALAALVLLSGCATKQKKEIKTAPKEDQKKVRIKVEKYEVPKVNVEVKDKKGKVVSKIEEQEMTIYKMRVKDYENKTLNELEAMLKGADAEETTVIIEALFHRSMDNYNEGMIKRRKEGDTSEIVDIDHVIRIYASLLDDKREVVLEASDSTLWMESKSIYEKPEIRIYAAYMAQRVSNGEIKPKGYEFQKHRSGILFCVKNGYAQVKDDVAKNWKEWWATYGLERYGSN